MVVIILLFALQAGADEPRFLKSSFPDGFSLKEPVKFYDAENLYEYINGQAVFYFSYGFKRLEHGFYGKGESTFYIDVYELGSRLSAFGSYRQQREEDSASLDAGCEGSLVDYLAVFYKGNYYIEIIPMSSGENDAASMKLLASYVDKLIPGETELPPEIALFPKEGLVKGSERYVDENLISYSFMGRGLVARYIPDGEENEVRVFIALAGSETKAKEIFGEYSSKLQGASKVKIGGTEGVGGKEPYRGTTILASYKNAVFGCLDVADRKKAVELLNAVYNSLKTSL